VFKKILVSSLLIIVGYDLDKIFFFLEDATIYNVTSVFKGRHRLTCCIWKGNVCVCVFVFMHTCSDYFRVSY
jgi:hypothetical protein